MKRLVLGLLIITSVSNVYAYELLGNNGKDFYGNCSNGDAFAGNVDSGGYYTVSGPGGSHFSQSMSEAIRKACGE
jgi:hypothetical protein